ncbi:MAG: hypothetical protein PHS14_03930 [Elusimicrobia bacterium]|nr:hypothetical protein [Elusimicrobiota bacterium]
MALLVWTFLTFALFAVSLTLLAVALCEHAAARKPAASDWPLYDPASGVASLRREAVVDYASNGSPLACTRASSLSPDGRVVCPQDYGAAGGGCGDGVSGALLVTWKGTGWVCPKLEPGKKAAVSASVLCCKLSG